MALLAYLSSTGPHDFHRRDALLALFWPEFDEERARNALELYQGEFLDGLFVVGAAPGFEHWLDRHGWRDCKRPQGPVRGEQRPRYPRESVAPPRPPSRGRAEGPV